MSENKIFRQAVLDRLASPEQLHTLMNVTDPKGWLALAGCGTLLAAALTWGVLGSVPTRVHAAGILINSAGLAEVVAINAGQITALEVVVGDHVHEGQVIARVAQPELVKEIANLQSQLAELNANYVKNKAMGSQDVRLRASVSAKERVGLTSNIDATQQRQRELEERLASQEKLFAKGLVTQELVQSTRQQLRSAESAVKQMRADVQRTAVDSFSVARANEASLQTDEMRMKEVERLVKLQRERLEQNEIVVSTHAGRVVELRVTVGDLLGPGSPIVSLERTSDEGGLEALLYVDSRQGKELKAGMEVQLSPSVVRRERHGVLLGKVLAVEDYPSTRRGMMRALHNEQLVETFIAETGGAPIAVRAQLLTDKRAPTGYRWSSGKGPTIELTSGTRLDADVTTRSQRPLSLLIPILDLDE
jgi:HlyD family secretion protein